MAAVIKSYGVAWMPPGYVDNSVGKYLESFDPDGFDGRGAVTWVSDIRAAKRFPSSVEALTEYRRASTTHPTREDGRANRPLTAFTVQIENVDD